MSANAREVAHLLAGRLGEVLIITSPHKRERSDEIERLLRQEKVVPSQLFPANIRGLCRALGIEGLGKCGELVVVVFSTTQYFKNPTDEEVLGAVRDPNRFGTS